MLATSFRGYSMANWQHCSRAWAKREHHGGRARRTKQFTHHSQEAGRNMLAPFAPIEWSTPQDGSSLLCLVFEAGFLCEALAVLELAL